MKIMLKKISFLLLILLSGPAMTFAQPVPGLDENIPHLVTFGSEGDIGWGDDNFCQIIFFKIPRSYTEPVYVRVYDPDTGGGIDEQKGDWNTVMSYSIFGGDGAWSEKDAQDMVLGGNYDSGTLLASKEFDANTKYDGKWYTFGPFNPSEGELRSEFGGYVFKIIIEGISGDDGNLYNLYLSNHPDRNHDVEGASAFYYKYKFRLHDDINEVAHIYPHIDENVVSIKQTNFDWDNDGRIQIVSLARPGDETMKIGGDKQWVSSTHKIFDEERTNSLDLQMIKSQRGNINNNNVVIFLENQYGEKLPFFSIPIGEYKYQSSISVEGF
jgi:hypothetical protein